jgi:hypothetical protein
MSQQSLNRRRFAGALAGLAATSSAANSMTPAEPNQHTKFYMMETFQLRQGTQLGRLGDWLSQSYLPRLSKVHSGPQIVLESVIAPHNPQLVLIVGYSSFEQLGVIRAKMDADSEVSAAFAKVEKEPEPLFDNQINTLLEATPYSPEVVVEKHPKPRLFELRTYHSPTWSQHRAVHERFAGPEIKVFHKCGIFPILYTSTVIGSNMPNLTYLIPFESLAAREKAWDAFAVDPDWIKARKESIDKGGQIVAVTDLSIYRAAAYSPVS